MCNNTALSCHRHQNLTQEQCTVLSLATGATDLAIATLSFALLMCVLFRRKRDAWNSPIKRMSLVFSFFHVLSALNLAWVELYNRDLPSGYCETWFFIYIYTKLAIALYVVVIVLILLIQAASPVIDRSWKQKLQSTNTVAVESVVHIIVSFLCLSFTVGEEFLDHTTDICVYRDCGHFDGANISYIIMMFLIFVIVLVAIVLVYVYVRFFRISGVTRRVKWAMTKFFTMLTLLVTTMALEISFYWMYEEEEYTSILVGEILINSSLLELCFFVTIMALLHLPSSECCRRNKAPRENERMALLAASNIQGTNPPSVWNHANVPSHTVFEPPPEMTDCVTE